NNTVAYCSPVMSADNEIIGVLANFFNWDFALEMITSGQYSELTNAVIINNRSKVIASAHESQIMQDHYDWLKAGRLSCKQHVGYSLEKARNGESLAVGFCYTKGYNAYRGKGWSAIISESINTTSIPIHAKPLSRRNNDGTTTLVYPEEASSQIDSEKSGLALINTMKEIDELVYEINANNREVKLLAVNASIQAGIAGSDGEGFSIIANEVALLAKKSLNFVETINIATDNLRKVVDESISIRLLDAAKDTSSKVDRNLFERYCDIQAWSTFNKFKEILEQQRFADKEAIELLQKIHKIYEVYHDLYILNVNGDVVASAIDQSMMNQNYENTEWFREALNGQIYYSDIEYAEHLKNPVIKFSSPIINENNEIIGVIVSWFNCNFLNDIIKATIVDSKSETYLINRRSQIIASKTPEEILKKSFKTESFIQNFSPNNSGITNKTPAKNEPAFIMGYSSSKGYNSYKGQNWVVVTQRPKNASQEAQSITPEQKFKQKIKWIV
ncbi:MAG: methyl-accepting chemotaxis protein, partial [Bdellovibrionaceae bacterium]|nr:methyl-accepting chemotaxis protein [Pseudobdellovibrionaceae bacterium]